MKIVISEAAVNWYKEELDVTDAPIYVRFYVRYGGVGGRIPGFSIGMNVDEPTDIHAAVEVDKITFYIEKADAWYFDGVDLIITLNEQLNEPQFTYEVA